MILVTENNVVEFETNYWCHGHILRRGLIEHYLKTNLGHKIAVEDKYSNAAVKQCLKRDMRSVLRTLTEGIYKNESGLSKPSEE